MLREVDPVQLQSCVDALFRGRVYKGKRIKEVKLRRSGRGYRAIIGFEDGTTDEVMLSTLFENL